MRVGEPQLDDEVVGVAPVDGAGEFDDLAGREIGNALDGQAGVTGLTIQLSYNTSENHKNTMAAVGDMLSNIGITTTMNEMEGTTYFKYLREGGDYDIARAVWVGAPRGRTSRRPARRVICARVAAPLSRRG